MTKEKLVNGVTPRGMAMYANLVKTERFKDKDGTMKDTGKFSVTLRLDDKALEAFRKTVTDVWNKFTDTLDASELKRMKNAPNLGIKFLKDDTEVIKFSQRKTIKCRDGSTFDKSVAVIDAHKHKISPELADKLGNDSVIRVAYELAPFKNSTTVYGVTPRLLAVQVIDYKEYTPENQAVGMFGEEDGFEVDADPTDGFNEEAESTADEAETAEDGGEF